MTTSPDSVAAVPEEQRAAANGLETQLTVTHTTSTTNTITTPHAKTSSDNSVIVEL